jgi:hypothetical protein
MKIITRGFLEQEPRACETHVEIFSREWPNGMVVSAENIRRAHNLGFGIGWFINNKLTDTARATFLAAERQARETYRAAVSPARAVYLAVYTASSTKEFCVARSQAQTVYQENIFHALAEAILSVEEQP